MDMPVILNGDAESLTVNVKLGEVPDPEVGTTESAVGAPPVTVHPPTCTKPELTIVSDASRYTFFAPNQSALKLRSTVITMDVTPMTTVVFAPLRVHCPFEATVLDPRATGAAPFAGLSKASDTTFAVRS
jgi:hypothetical protein